MTVNKLKHFVILLATLVFVGCDEHEQLDYSDVDIICTKTHVTITLETGKPWPLPKYVWQQVVKECPPGTLWEAK